MKKFGLLISLLLLTTQLVWGQTVVFTESMGTVSATTTIAAHETANGFDNDSYTMTSGGAATPADLRVTSTSSGYTGASGLANLWFTSTAGEYGFAIEGIDASTYTNLTVQFGYRKESALALPTLALDYWDGTNYVNIPFTFNEAADAGTGWYLSPTINLPEAAQISGLRLRWVKTGSVAVRIDDVKLSRVSSDPSIFASTNILSGFTYAQGSGPSAEQFFDVSGSNLTSDITITPPTNYEISTGTGGSFSATNPITLIQSGGSVALTRIYVLLKAGLSIGAYNQSITASSTGATDNNIYCNGSVTAPILVLPLIENFDYIANTNLTDNGWVVHSTGTNPITVNNSGLSYTDYVSSGIGNAALVDNTGEDVSKLFASVSSGTIYYSFLVNVTAGPDGYFLHLGSSTTSFASRIFVKPSATIGKINFGISNTSTGSYATTPTDFDLLTTYLIIVKYNVSTTGDASLWVISSGVPASEVAAGTPEHTTSGTGLANIERICLRQYSASQNLIVDGIRVATSWLEAPVPVELTSFSAAAIGSSVKLSWNTATEVNNYGFEIERSTPLNPLSRGEAEGRGVWEKIGFVEGNGTSNSPKNYSYTDAFAVSGKYSYRLKQIDNDGQFEYSKIIEVDLGTPKNYEISQNYPNPFNPNTAIKFSLPEAGNVKLTVYNLLGQEVKILVNGVKEAGTHIINFNAEKLNSGVYIYRIESKGFNEVRKMTLIK